MNIFSYPNSRFLGASEERYFRDKDGYVVALLKKAKSGSSAHIPSIAPITPIARIAPIAIWSYFRGKNSYISNSSFGFQSEHSIQGIEYSL